MTPYLPALTRLLDLLNRLLDHRGDLAEEAHDTRQLLRREVRRLRTLAGADTERHAVVLVHRDRRVEHIHGGQRLGRAVQTVRRVAVKGFDERREVRDRDLLLAGALATGEGDGHDSHAVVIDPDLDALASDSDGGGVDGGSEKLGHDELRRFPVCCVGERGTVPSPHV